MNDEFGLIDQTTYEGEDESKYFKHFELTHTGEPININEYAAEIAQHKRTHVYPFFYLGF